MRWIGVINQRAEMKTLSFSSQWETQALPLLKSKRLKRSATDASLKSLALLGPLKAVKMLVSGADYLRMSVAH
jgi:hypothetical protein